MSDTEEPMQTDPAVQVDLNTSRPEQPRDLFAEYAPIEVEPLPDIGTAFENNGPRLMITHIVNENFKSYAGSQTLGPFHKSFSAIVGPNGSGKSNVIDSMLFVFGFRANKIRSKKISVLIHNSQEHKNINSCCVCVYFQKIVDTGPGEDEYDVVPDSKFHVSRTAHKDSTSYYCIDGKRATIKEVGRLLRGQGIDLDHNRFLILQGEVEQIAMMKPKGQTEHDDGMLEFLEDIIGSNRYKEPIERLNKRVEELNELRAEKLNRVKAVEKEKDELEGAKDEAIAFLQIENAIAKLKFEMYLFYIFTNESNHEKASKQLEEEKEKNSKVLEKMKVVTDNKKEKTKEHKKMYKALQLLQNKCDEAKAKFSEIEQQDVKCREDLKHAKAQAKKLDRSLDQEKKKIEELEKVPEESEKHIADLKNNLEKIEKERVKEEKKVEEVMANMKIETKGLQEEKEAKEKDLLGLQKGVNETKSKFNVAQSELDIILSNQQSEENKLRETKRNLEKVTTTLKERKTGMQGLEKKVPEDTRALERAKKDLAASSAAEEKITNEVRNLRLKLEEARSSMQAARSKGRVIDALMEQKRLGKIKGIYGRLGDLGAIDDKYDCAISTACGPLDNIVCDNMNTAQQCVQFIKKNNIGIVTCIALDKMQQWKRNMSQKINTPENVPRLFDLVKVKDDAVLPAFYFALRDTLVAKDLDQASRISYGKTRYRVVTLGGELIDISGTMSGGSKKKITGRMGSAVMCEMDPKEIEQTANQLTKSAEEAQVCRENKAKLEETVAKLQKEVNNMKHSFHKFEMDIKAMTEQESSLTVQLKECEERVKAAAPDPKKLKDMEKNVAALKKDYDKAAAAAKTIEDAVKELHHQIMDIGGAKLKAVQSRLDSINHQVDTVTGQITKANVAVKTAARNLKKSEDKVESIETEIKENRELIEKLQTHFKEIEQEAMTIMKIYEDAQAEFKVETESVATLTEEISVIEKEEEELQLSAHQVNQEVLRWETLCKESHNKIRYWKKELKQLQLHTIEGREEEKMPVLTEEEVKAIDKEELNYKITCEEARLQNMKPNMTAIAEYKKKNDTYLKRVHELDQITDLRDQQRRNFENLRKRRLDEFMTGFGIITNKLKEMYQMITLGGDAELELVDSLDPFSEGIVFSVRPPKKSWKNISNLSGGEKTLSSLALVFALHHYKPTPLYVMDEIDAALDFKNVSIVANYIKERTKNAQFIIISLRNNMFELADRLIGIYKTYNSTKSVTINPAKLTMPLAEVKAN
ncbi:structural maintenance of chromosomes protein 4-like [Lineus longissimus]|uniref:structural maintenance of chromosomes protein 4-like n=1 Tax=Lineus longissimus TaxID=88925 RepID=UPI002B4DC5B0